MKVELETVSALQIPHLAHEVGQLVHGVGETLGLSLDGCIASPLVTPEPERRENCSHLLAPQLISLRLELKAEKWITNRG